MAHSSHKDTKAQSDTKSCETWCLRAFVEDLKNYFKKDKRRFSYGTNEKLNVSCYRQ